MAEEKYQYLDRDSIFTLTKGIFASVNDRIAERIVSDIDASSDDKHVPSAAAVYDAILNASRGGFVKTENHAEESNPQSDVIYIEPISGTSACAMFIYDPAEDEDENPGTGTWIALGAAQVDLSNYYTKQDIDALKSDLGIENLQEVLEEKVDEDEMELIESETISDIIKQALYETYPYGELTFTLTINYVDTEGESLQDPHVQKNMKPGDSYNVKSPTIKEKALKDKSQTTISGTIGYTDITINVVYVTEIDADKPDLEL